MVKTVIKIRRLITVIALAFLVLVIVTGGLVADRLFGFKPLDKLFPRKEVTSTIIQGNFSQEQAVIAINKAVTPSVVTISAQTPQRRILTINPFGGLSQSVEGGIPQDIGTGFIVSTDGLIVTNKHVVSVTGATYQVITSDNQTYDAKEISKDPSNDIAIIKIDAQGLKPIEMGDSTNLQVGQFVIAIGTALGQFRDTLTTGVISGLGRGITAGSVFEGYVEQLDNVIQTDAAINPGNSGGPLLNSSGKVIGINVAVASGAQNIGFAIPVNTVKDAIAQFQKTGKFADKAYLGVKYSMIDATSAKENKVPEGAFVQDVVTGSPAETAGIKANDIITKIDSVPVTNTNGGLSKIVAGKKPGDKIVIEVWRNEAYSNLTITLTSAPTE